MNKIHLHIGCCQLINLLIYPIKRKAIKFFFDFYFLTAVSCFDKIESNGKCTGLLSNFATKEDCCSGMLRGVAYRDPMNNEQVFQLLAGLNQEDCKPCKGVYAQLIT